MDHLFPEGGRWGPRFHFVTFGGAFALSILLFPGCRPTQATAGRQMEVLPTSVQITRASQGPITRHVSLPAQVAANQQVVLYSKVAGYLKRIEVDKGDVVEVGQLLAEIEVPDPAVQLEVNPGELVPLTLMESNPPIAVLIHQARLERPELKQSQAALEAARNAKQGASYGPLFPSVDAQVFAGGLGGGVGGSWGNFADQQDYFVGLTWRIGPGGLFDRGRTKAVEARARAAALEAEKADQEVGRQVVDAVVRVESLARQLSVARDAMKVAEQGFKLARTRQEFGVGIVLENIQAEQELTRARLDFARKVAEHNKAQYALAYVVGSRL